MSEKQVREIKRNLCINCCDKHFCHGMQSCKDANEYLKKGNRMICLDCSLRIFVSTVETIIEICDEKEKIGISHLYDSDILDIQSKLKKECVIDVECSYIENVLNYLIESDS